jgi:hypothetical protein
VAKEEVGEELLGSAELTTASALWGNNRRKLPPVRCSWRKMMAGKSHGPASPAGAVGRLLLQEGRDDEALLLSQLDSSGRLIGDRRWRAKQRPAQSRAARSVGFPHYAKTKLGWQE